MAPNPKETKKTKSESRKNKLINNLSRSPSSSPSRLPFDRAAAAEGLGPPGIAAGAIGDCVGLGQQGVLTLVAWPFVSVGGVIASCCGYLKCFVAWLSLG